MFNGWVSIQVHLMKVEGLTQVGIPAGNSSAAHTSLLLSHSSARKEGRAACGQCHTGRMLRHLAGLRINPKVCLQLYLL